MYSEKQLRFRDAALKSSSPTAELNISSRLKKFFNYGFISDFFDCFLFLQNLIISRLLLRGRWLGEQLRTETEGDNKSLLYFDLLFYPLSSKSRLCSILTLPPKVEAFSDVFKITFRHPTSPRRRTPLFSQASPATFPCSGEVLKMADNRLISRLLKNVV